MRFSYFFSALSITCVSISMHNALGADTPSPTLSPTQTNATTPAPTPSNHTNTTAAPTLAPTSSNHTNTTDAPTAAPTMAPTNGTTPNTTATPTISPTGVPTIAPTRAPTVSPTLQPTSSEEKTHHFSFFKLLGKIVAWMCLIFLAIVAFGGIMNHRYRIFYFLRGVWYSILGLECTGWLLERLGRRRDQQQPMNDSSQYTILFDNEMSEGLLMRESNE